MSARLVVMASGGGRSLENLQREILAGRLDAEIVRVVVSRRRLGAVARAEGLGLPWTEIGKESHPRREDRDRALVELWEAHGADWVVLAGWLLLAPVPPAWEGRILNIHPALLPAFGGPGYYGSRVHRAVLAAAPLLSGCTVHFASEAYDQGPTILAEAVPVLPGDDADRLAERVFAAEKRVLPEALRLLIAGRARFQDGTVRWA